MGVRQSFFCHMMCLQVQLLSTGEAGDHAVADQVPVESGFQLGLCLSI